MSKSKLYHTTFDQFIGGRIPVTPQTRRSLEGRNVAALTDAIDAGVLFETRSRIINQAQQAAQAAGHH